MIANFALTLDGKVSTKSFSHTGFTSTRDKCRLREIRAMGDALLVGASTVAADAMSMGLSDPLLQSERRRRGQAPEPLRVILSNSGRIDPEWKVFSNARSPLVIFVGAGAGARLPKTLPDFCDLWAFDSPCVPMKSVLKILKVDYRVGRVVCEGGPRVLRALAEIRALDRMYITFTNKVFGGAQAPTLCGLNTEFLSSPIAFRLASLEYFNEEVFTCFKARSSEKKLRFADSDD